MERNFGKLQVGQEIWVKVEEMSNASRRLDKENIEEWIYKGEVVKIGRKYITVKFKNDRMDYYHEDKFNIEDDYKQVWTSGGANYKLYLTKQDITNEIESNELYYKIKLKFEGYINKEFTLNQLRKIVSIIESVEV